MTRISAVFLLMVIGRLMPVQAQQEPPSLQPGYHLAGDVFSFGMISSGSQYFHDEWLSGEVMLTNGESVSAQFLRYNGYLDELIWLPSTSRSPVRVDKGLVRRFSLDMPGQAGPVVFENLGLCEAFLLQESDYFAQRLYDGHLTLLVRREVVRDGRLPRTDGGKIYHITRLKKRPVYLVVMPGHEIFTMRKIRHRFFEDLLPQQRRELREVLRHHRIRVRSEADLIRAVEAAGELFH
jgi:hypothetical protein